MMKTAILSWLQNFLGFVLCVQAGSCNLVLDAALHQYVAMTLVEAYSRHLPNHPGGCDYSTPSSSLSSSTVSTLTKVRITRTCTCRWISLDLKLLHWLPAMTKLKLLLTLCLVNKLRFLEMLQAKKIIMFMGKQALV